MPYALCPMPYQVGTLTQKAIQGRVNTAAQGLIGSSTLDQYQTYNLTYNPSVLHNSSG